MVGLRFFLACVLAFVGVPLVASTDPRSDAGCKFSWRALGCTPAAECRLQFKPWFGTLGPCKKHDDPSCANYGVGNCPVNAYIRGICPGKCGLCIPLPPTTTSILPPN